jgi:hypothetical protein
MGLIALLSNNSAHVIHLSFSQVQNLLQSETLTVLLVSLLDLDGFGLVLRGYTRLLCRVFSC